MFCVRAPKFFGKYSYILWSNIFIVLESCFDFMFCKTLSEWFKYQLINSVKILIFGVVGWINANKVIEEQFDAQLGPILCNIVVDSVMGFNGKLQ